MRSNKDSQTLGRNLPRNVTFDQLNPVGMTPISKSRDDINSETEKSLVRRSISTPSNMNDSDENVTQNNSTTASAAANDSK